jgi:SSS family solute:Na+ symporter
MACSGNVVTDLLHRIPFFARQNELRLSQWITLMIGSLALIIALYMDNVLELMLHSYAFMVAGLFVPVLFGLYGKRPSARAAMAAMGAGGITTLGLTFAGIGLPFGLDPIAFGLLASFVGYAIMNSPPLGANKQL